MADSELRLGVELMVLFGVDDDNVIVVDINDCNGFASAFQSALKARVSGLPCAC